MKALVYTGPRSLALSPQPDPQPRPGEVLIAVESVGICGSDMHAYLGHDDRRPAPLILGHEAAGTIVSGSEIGRRVTINPLVTCSVCAACRVGRNNLCADRQIISMPPRAGAFAEFVSIPPANLITVPDNMPLSKAALAEPLACGWHAVRLAHEALRPINLTVQCLVIGGGAIGLASALAMKAKGQCRITIAETNAARHKALRKAGDFHVIDPTTSPDADANHFDVVIDAVGYAPTRDLATRAVRPGGVVVHIGLGEGAGGLDIRRMTLQEITFVGTYTYTPDDFRDTTQAMFDGSLGDLDWFEERPLEAGAEAFAEILAGKVQAPKLMLRVGGARAV